MGNRNFGAIIYLSEVTLTATSFCPFTNIEDAIKHKVRAVNRGLNVPFLHDKQLYEVFKETLRV